MALERIPLKREWLDRLEAQGTLRRLQIDIDLAEKAWMVQNLMVKYFCPRGRMLDSGTIDETLQHWHFDHHDETSVPRFKFMDLPPELRFNIYAYIVPVGLLQSYWLDSVTKPNKIARSRRVNSIPSLLRVSRKILDEATDSLLKRHCKVSISQDRIVANFPLEAIVDAYRNPCQPITWEAKIQLSNCEKLSIVVEQPPSPRRVEKFLQTRRVVDNVVGWLNSNSDLTPSHIEVKLAFDRQPDGFRGVWNDFAMLLGPLSKLDKPSAHAHVARPDARQLEVKIEQQCNGLEKILSNEFGEAKRVFEYQQTILDIRLLVSQILADIDWSVHHPLKHSDAPLGLAQSYRTEIDAALKRLQMWYSTHHVAEAPWIHDLNKTIRDPAISRGEAAIIFVEVLGERGYPLMLERWMAGFAPAFDPFQYPKGEGVEGWAT